MAHVYGAIDDRWAAWIAEQPMFFVATAPLSADGHVNVSPKGPAGELRVLGPPESTRAVIVVDVERIADSCGYGVPLMSVDGEREHYALSAAKRLRTGGPDALVRRRAEVNARSIDGLPALDPA